MGEAARDHNETITVKLKQATKQTPGDLRRKYDTLPQVAAAHLHDIYRRANRPYTTYDYFGGAILMTPRQIEEINGFPNTFYGWGGEDDEMLQRIKNAHMKVDRYPMEIASYFCLFHKKDKENPTSDRS
ncbi:hypothetical protein LSH36_1123g00038 [Paralvinella palmiformis]|uniref:Galactosyltransferase C-terminal domain-containing protein n=1 Tax=Paralvinella palmiformis TaxID=53620 RepID=A0AAD9IVF3_9ANNE|nr:hypothetical protein LSH36_1123g00038 [Paralvinella palmiformis]